MARRSFSGSDGSPLRLARLRNVPSNFLRGAVSEWDWAEVSSAWVESIGKTLPTVSRYFSAARILWSVIRREYTPT